MNTDDAMKTFVNAIRQNVNDIEQFDIDERPVGFRPSKSYWIDEGWDRVRWSDYGLPQIAVFELEGNTAAEGAKTNNERYELSVYQVNVFASGRRQMNGLSTQVKNGFYNRTNRLSTLSSGLKIDKKISEFDTIEDEFLPQQVFRKQMSFRVFYHSSGS